MNRRFRARTCAYGARALRLALVGLMSAFWIACDESGAYVREAQKRMAQAEFDPAFELFQQAYIERPDNPEALAGLGRMLTLERVSLFAGIDLLQRSLALQPDDGVREELMLLFIGLRRFDLARGLIDPEKLSVGKLYSPEITRFRLGLECIESPDRLDLEKLQALPQHARRDYFITLCRLGLMRRADDLPPILASWRSMADRSVACEALLLWPNDKQPAPDFVEAELAACRRAFPASVALRRGPLPELKADPARTSRTLYRTNVFAPDDPGADVAKPSYNFGNAPPDPSSLPFDPGLPPPATPPPAAAP
jgi:tetratricopeptide (TPR) repeat protein